jgi:hypothetical protein
MDYSLAVMGVDRSIQVKTKQIRTAPTFVKSGSSFSNRTIDDYLNLFFFKMENIFGETGLWIDLANLGATEPNHVYIR